jgi:hypothetical protein
MPAIFVHGVSVREADFSALLSKVILGISANVPNPPVTGYYWGNLASSLRVQGASIPGFVQGARALETTYAVATADGGREQLLSLLLDDPYLELALSADPQELNPAGAGLEPMPGEVISRNQGLAAAEPGVVADLIGDAQLTVDAGAPIRPDRIREVVQQALDAAGRTDRSLTAADLIAPLTRCLTAALYGESVGRGEELTPKFAWTAIEKRIEDILARQLGGRRGFTNEYFRRSVLGAGTAILRQHRRRIMAALSAFIGDILVYPQNRKEILDGLEARVQEASAADPGGELRLIGHSLGGIVCYDYCVRTHRTVDHLFTVGSQVGLYGELGGIPTSASPDGRKFETPTHIRRWTNIYDLNDMLSFLAEPIFTRVRDIPFDTGAPFPAAHGEYWNRPTLYEIMD